MTLLGLAEWLELYVFVTLACAALEKWRRRRDPAAGWLAVTFALLGGILVADRFIPISAKALGGWFWFDRVLIVDLALVPYCLYRFTSAFLDAPRRAGVVAGVGTALFSAVAVALPEIPGGHPGTWPWWYAVYVAGFLAGWTALSFISVVRLWRGGRGQPTVIRQRMRMLATAAVVLNATLFLLANSSDHAWTGLASAVLFLMGFAPPPALRARWRRPELEAFRRAEADLMRADTTERVTTLMLPHAARLVGASAAVLTGTEGEVRATHGIGTPEAAALAGRLPPPNARDDRPVVRGDVVAVRVRSGWLAVATTAATPFFGIDELSLLQTLAHLAGLALDRAELFDRERTSRQAFIYQAGHDALTQLPNRALFLDRLGQVMTRRSRHPSGTAVLFLDLDRFKWLNDSLGHAAGDELLIEVAARLRDAMRAEDTVARFGGDEFVVLCDGVADQAEAEAMAGRLAAVLAAPVMVAGEETTVTVSIGIAYAPPTSTGDTPESLVRDADAAMYRAKEQGRNRHAVFDVTTLELALVRHETVNALRRGFQHHELVVHYQPALDLDTGRAVGVEALVRWDHPQRGLLAPGEFIALAEETGLVVPLGTEVLATACRQVMAWHRDGQAPEDLWLSVNLAVRQLLAADLGSVVEEALVDSGLPPDRLCLEITESALLEDTESSTRALNRLKALGVCIGVDDFGTGFSSLTYLKRFPVDVLKIDRSFVAGLCRDHEDRAIVASVIDLAHAFGLTTTAEGVETAEQLDQLRTLGCEQGQGYLWSRPLPAGAAGRWLAAHRHELLVAPPAGRRAGEL